MEPRAFLANIVDAVVGGVQRFADSFGDHLKTGVIGWLTGTLGSAGITLPPTFDLMGVLDLARQILGLTWERFRAKAVKLVGEQNVASGCSSSAATSPPWSPRAGGRSGKAQGPVGDAEDMVFDGIKSFLLERIMVAAMIKMIPAVLPRRRHRPAGDDRLEPVHVPARPAVAASPSSSPPSSRIGDIARGVLDGAMATVEEVLGSLVPLALDLLARLLGLGNLGEDVREVIEKVRATIDKAIDAIIEKVANAFRGGFGASGAATSAAPRRRPEPLPAAPVTGATQAEPGAGFQQLPMLSPRARR